MSVSEMHRSVKNLFIEPESPWENGYVEAFNGRFREGCLNESWFLSLEDAREKVEEWRQLCLHTFAIRFLINDGDVFALQQILVHSTLEMVRHYLYSASNQIAIQHQRCSRGGVLSQALREILDKSSHRSKE